jgi:hypothetical protein
MPDNYNHIDPEFLDHGWSEMKKLLDRDMPVRAVPFWRRKGLLWLFLLLIPFSAALGFYHFVWKKGTETPPLQAPVPAPIPQKPVASLDDPENCPETNVLPATPTAEALNIIAANVLSQPQADLASYTPETVTPITRITTAESSEINHTITALAFLPPLHSPLTTHHSPFTLHPSLITTHHSPITNPPPSLTLESGPFSTASLRSAGFSAALAVSHAFGKSGWGIQGGLGYSYFNNPFPVAALTHNNKAEDFQELEVGLGNTPVNFDTAGSIEAFASSADSTVSHLHYLDIPVVATRKLGSRWQLQAGASLGLLLASRTETGSDAGYGLVSGNVQRAYDDQTTGGFSEAEAAAALSRLRLANPSFQAGIAYFPHPRWSVGLQINAALLDAMPDWPGRQFLNKAQIKLGYRF